MHSISKTPLTAEIAQTLITAQFGTACRVRCFEELKEGMFNTAALLELEDGLKCVLKIAPPEGVRVLRYERDIMKAEVGAMRLVRAQTGVPTPKIYGCDTSRSLIGSEYFIMEFLPGTPFHKLRASFSPAEQTAIDQSVGRITCEIASITGSSFGLYSQPELPGVPWRVSIEHLLRGILLDGQEMEVAFPISYDGIFQQLEIHFAALDEVTTPSLVHWDLWDGNIFVDPLTKQITGLIDFERALWGDPLMEVIFGPFNPIDPFIQGYGAKLLETPNQRTRRALYNAYLYLIMVIECYYRQYTNKDQENWARGMLDGELKKLRG